MAFTKLENDFIEACCDLPPDFPKAKALLNEGANINAVNNYGENVANMVIQTYPQEFSNCYNCEAESCQGCSSNNSIYLPEAVKFLLANGWNVKDRGYQALHALCYSTYTKEIFDAAKLICKAGINAAPLVENDTMEAIGTEESYNRCEGDHHLENLFYALYELVEHARTGRSFEHIDTYHAAIGLQIDQIVVFGPDSGIGTDELGRTTFAYDIGLVCGEKTVIIKEEMNILLMNGLQHMLPCIAADELFGIPLIGRSIRKISFAHNDIIKENTSYGQPVINLHLDNGTALSFTHNFGEMPEKKRISRFSVIR